jgi:hypothetical protein
MSAVLGIALAVVVVIALALVVANRRAGLRAERAEDNADQLTVRLGESLELIEEIQSQSRAAEVRASAAESRIRAAEQKATDAERRAGDAEKRVAEANRRAGEAIAAGAEARSAAALWQLERLRAAREWADVVGPGIDLPMAWDDGMAALIAAELAVIRETMGTPSELELIDRSPMKADRAAVVGRAGIEVLRRLARSGDVMNVVLDRQELRVTQPVAADESRPDLSDLREACAAGGLQLTTTEADDHWEIALAFNRSS